MLITNILKNNMALDFGVTDSVYCKALKEIKATRIPEEHFREVNEMLDGLAKQFEQERKDQIVSFTEMNKPFDL